MRRVLALVLIAGASLSGCSFTGEDAQGAKRNKPKHPNVVLVVFDEFGGDILLGPDGTIDAGRFPHFAQLANDGTWFRNAQTRYDSTTKAVPLILDGIAPRPGTSPTVRDHPHSIFTALGAAGYRIDASEEATAMCPRTYCRHERTTRPAIIPFLESGRAERFERWVRSIRASSRPTLWMKHALLPHGPWVYLPDGRMMRPPGGELLPGMQTIPGFYDDYLRHHNEQRQLLQLGFADRLLGRLIARLKREGIYDDTLIVVTADHGFAWKVGVPTRRSVSLSNVDELGSVPMIVKRPGQRAGRVSGALAQTLDVAPTIASVAGVPLGYHADGRSIYSHAVRARRTVRIVKRDFSSVVSISKRRWIARRKAVVRRRLRQLGSGDWQSLFTAWGPRIARLGRPPRAAGKVLDRRVVRVDRSSGVVPCEIAGRIHGSAPDEKRDVAVAVNGRIAAVGRSFHLRGERVESYAVMVPEGSLRDGRNEIEVLGSAEDRDMALPARS